jgi:hemerythrin-like domain-containing protein
MEARQVSIQSTPCCDPLPDLEVPMINTMVACLGSEHRKLDRLIMQLALVTTRLAANPDAASASQQAKEVWAEIRRNLWSHLQIEDELVFSWGEAHHAIPGTLLDTLKIERQEMRELIGALPALSSDLDREPKTAEDRGEFARTLLALTRTLDSHVERFDREVLPSILRAVFHQ